MENTKETIIGEDYWSIAYRIIVANTFYRDIHKYTRIAPTKNEKSIVDYALVERNARCGIVDVDQGTRNI